MIKNTNHLVTNNKMIPVGIGVAILWWFFEVMMDTYVFQEGLFIERFFPAHDPNELWMRLVPVCLFVGFGIYARSAMSKPIKMSESLSASNQQLMAGEQQLKAANQQLRAGEQQLKAAEQQLRATNQQLVAREQQLRGANQQLKASEERFRDFFANAPVGFHTFGPDRVIADINETELAMIGYIRDEVIGKKIWTDLIIPEQRDQFEKHWQDLITKGQVRNLEYTLVHKDGHNINVVLNASSRFDEHSNLIYTRGSVLDITERKRAAEQIENLAKFPSENPNPVLRIAKNGTLLYANDAGRLLLAEWNIEVGQLVPDTWCQTIAEVFASGSYRRVEAEYTGRIFAFVVAPIPEADYANLYGRDITERKEIAARQELTGKVLERLNRKSQAFEMVQDIIALIKESTGFTAVGIRLRQADDFPYFVVDGFSDDFVKAENCLCTRNEKGEQVFDEEGRPALECLCGAVIMGVADLTSPFITKAGSFWTNNTTKLMSSSEVQALEVPIRNRCNQAGYESVALIPLCSGDQTVGLLQLNDTLPDCFTPEMISFFEGICASIGIALARIEAEQEIKNLAKFPSENPNPVLRIAKNGVVLYANGASGSLLAEWGCQVGQTAPKNWCRTVSDVFASGSARRIEVAHADSIFAFMIVPVVEADYVNLYGRDITERKKAQEVLQASEEQFRRAVLDSPFPIMIHAEDGEVLQISKVWTDLTGYTPQEIPTMSAWTERAYGERRDIVKSRIEKMFDCDERVEEGEYVISSKDGKTLIWDFSSAPLGKLPDGRRLVISMAMDITERKQAEQEIQNLAKFPSEDPNPVLRIAREGMVLYANAAGSELLKIWECNVGERVPEHWHQYVLRMLKSGSSEELEVVCGERVFSLIMTPVVDAGYVNAYGVDISERKLAEEDLRRYRQHLEKLVETRTAELTQANEQLLQEIEARKGLEKEILSVSEQERRKIGQELHDSLGQQLTGIAFMTKVLEQKLAKKSLDEAADVIKIAKLVNQATAQAHSLAKGLHPVDLDTGTLVSALQELAMGTETLFDVHCIFKSDKLVHVNDHEVAVHLYRITQEAITNAIKHGKAKNIQIGLVYGRSKSVLTVKSDGLDFPKDFEAKYTGMGLQIMDHRVDIIGGSLDIHKAPEGGTIVVCGFPNKKQQQ
ncbi:MAG: PAS domain S-box protein [Planctomycetes bacterium]|nr:PAS domain S-box protein [Planctomycetota bacterium]